LSLVTKLVNLWKKKHCEVKRKVYFLEFFLLFGYFIGRFFSFVFKTNFTCARRESFQIVLELAELNAQREHKHRRRNAHRAPLSLLLDLDIRRGARAERSARLQRPAVQTSVSASGRRSQELGV